MIPTFRLGLYAVVLRVKARQGATGNTEYGRVLDRYSVKLVD